ncbi:hypothetical protein OC835_007167 [Tilletia horrida]|nr:hypothetical protein OC835_007167 [Tilletia horrida]
MATTASHNRKSSAVKRILSEAKELAADPSTEYAAQPLESNIFEWHFTLRGPQDTEFEHGLYHGRILLPPEYPFRPPNLMVLTPNGRWELNKKICLSFTGYHEEMWQPAWGIRTALLGMQSLMAARAKAAIGIGALDYPPEERKRLALKSKDWACPTCAATCAELLGSASRPEKKAEDKDKEAATKALLPEGLSVDTEAETRKAEAAANASSSNEANTSTSSTSAADLLTPSNSASMLSDDYPASPDPSGTSTPQGHADVTPHQVITTAGPVQRAVRAPAGSSGAAGGGRGGGAGAGGSARGGAGSGPSGLSSSAFRAHHHHHPHHHHHHDIMPSPAARLSAEMLPARSSSSSPSASGTAAAAGSANSGSEGVSSQAAGGSASSAPAATRTTQAAIAPAPASDVTHLAVLDRCIAALTLLVGVLLLRMVVL